MVSEQAPTACAPGTRVTKSLLGYGVLAGPVYVAAVLAQGLTRPGFDLTRRDASLLSNGDLGWIQIANFVVTGLMVLACAVGVDRALAAGAGATWGPRLLGLFGLGLIAAGLFVADPMNGFPLGTPPGRPQLITVHGMLHIASAGVAFLCLVAACFVLARRFASQRRRAWVRFSRATGIAFLAAFLGLASGSSSPVFVLTFWAALILAWAWIGALSVDLYRQVSSSGPVA